MNAWFVNTNNRLTEEARVNNLSLFHKQFFKEAAGEFTIVAKQISLLQLQSIPQATPHSSCKVCFSAPFWGAFFGWDIKPWFVHTNHTLNFHVSSNLAVLQRYNFTLWFVYASMV